MGDNGYSLDLLSPVRHVATQLSDADGAPSGALSVAEMATSYRHPNLGDLARVKREQNLAGNTEAEAWLINQAIIELGKQVESDGNGGYLLARRFEKLRYPGNKHLHRDHDGDEQQALQAVYNDLGSERPFYVTIAGARGSAKEIRLWLHPLAHAIPQVGKKEFFELAADVKKHGVRNPITLFDGRVLDGRHRLAVASALKMPVRTVVFDGDENAARDEVVSQNAVRRHLTIAQRALIVQELFLPQAEAEAKQRQGARTDLDNATSAHSCAEVAEPDRAAMRAKEEAAKASNGLATVRTLQTMDPVRNAPRTQEKIRQGEIKSAAQARREALKETGSDEPEKAPAAQPRSAWDRLGCALGDVKSARDTLISDEQGTVPREKIVDRINEIRMLLDDAEKGSRSSRR